MVDYGLHAPLEPPILHTVSETSPPTITFTQIHSYTACVSQQTDEELDYEIQLLHQHFPNAGITMLHGHFCQMGENVPCEWICQALNQISPANHSFHCPCLRRRRYQVPGPNYLWHHDGQHGMLHVFCSISHYLYWDHVGLIQWKIVVHAFVDGHDHMITAMHASNNNRAITVLDLFLDGVHLYGLPSWV